MGLTEMEWEGVDRIDLAQDEWRAFVSALMKFGVP
jgi:hypothetical protein